MKGKNPSAKQKKFHDLLVKEIGCPACHADNGMRNHHCSVHHLDGRTKPHAHWHVLPLCAGHHQDGYGAPGMIAVHPYKARFEEQYGKQMGLLEEAVAELHRMGHPLPAEALELIQVSA